MNAKNSPFKYSFRSIPVTNDNHGDKQRDIKRELEERIQSELSPFLRNSNLKINLKSTADLWQAEVVIDTNRGFKATRRQAASVEDLIDSVIGDLRIQFELAGHRPSSEIFLFNQQQEYEHYEEALGSAKVKIKSQLRNQTELKVLVLEDDPTAQLILDRSMHAMGCQVDIASDPESAIEKIATHHYDLLILDWCLPYMNGHEFLRKADERLKQKQNTRPVPLVICSGKNSNEINLPLVTNFVFCQYWNKGLPFSTVISSIDNALKSARLHKQLA